jgi:hypothetical protein
MILERFVPYIFCNFIRVYVRLGSIIVNDVAVGNQREAILDLLLVLPTFTDGPILSTRVGDTVT